MTWLHLSSIYEPSNYTRKVVGFDTFAGIPRLSSLEESAPAAKDNARLRRQLAHALGDQRSTPAKHRPPPPEDTTGHSSITISPR
ncbi:MAG: hypothetical protein ACRDSL_10055 [Pseudonocardiaceae bacterium]